jgi:uncharacterized protein (DUF433 family)
MCYICLMQLPTPLITVSPQRLSGAPVFTGTRVPVQALFDYLEAGDTLEAFLEDFPNVSREHAVAVLKSARTALLANPQAA